MTLDQKVYFTQWASLWVLTKLKMPYKVSRVFHSPDNSLSETPLQVRISLADI